MTSFEAELPIHSFKNQISCLRLLDLGLQQMKTDYVLVIKWGILLYDSEEFVRSKGKENYLASA